MRVLVIGDSCLDRYIFTKTIGESPEHPVPKLAVSREVKQAGMAANAASILSAANADVSFLTFLADDDAGRQVAEQLSDVFLFSRGVASATTTKTRIIQDGKHIARIDDDHHVQQLDTLGSLLSSMAASCDVVVLSDYGKGIYDPSMRPTLEAVSDKLYIDPHPSRSLSDYPSCKLIKLNAAEFDIFGPGIFSKAEHVVVTHAHRGSTLWLSGEARYTTPPVQVDAVEVAGAGDVYLAHLVLNHKLDIRDAMDIASHEASKSVTREGTS